MKITNIIVLIITVSSLLAQQPANRADALVTPRVSKTTLTVGGNNADIAGFSNEAIQYAIDAIAQSGGTVRLNRGVFDISAPIRMRSNIDLVVPEKVQS